MATRELGSARKSQVPETQEKSRCSVKKSCRKRYTTVLKSTLWKKPWDRKRRRVRRQISTCGAMIRPSPTSQPQRAVPAEFSHRSFARQGPRTRPGPRRARISTTNVPGTRIGARTITPATVVPPGTRWKGDVHPIATAVTTDVHHQRQDVPVTEVGKGIQRQGRQLQPTLVATIQRDSRGRHGGLALRAGIASGANPSGHPGSSQQVHEQGKRGSTDFPVSPSMPTCRGSTTDRSRSSSSGEICIVHISKESTESAAPADLTSRADGPAEVADLAQLADSAQVCWPVRPGRPVRGCRPGTDGLLGRGAWAHTWGAALSTREPRGPACRAWMGSPCRSQQHVLTRQQALLTRSRTSLQLGHPVSPGHVWCQGLISHRIRCQWHISNQQATKMYLGIPRHRFSRPFSSTSTSCSLLTS